ARLGEGPLFRPVDRFGRLGEERLQGRAVARIVKRAAVHQARAAGFSEAEVAELAAVVGGHSLRSGFATSAAKAGMGEWEIMRQTCHKKRETLQQYIRLGTLFRPVTTILDL
ncbi:MAG: hypothetical protein HQL41_18505, partial [Alphaproteobacteria bacterium]|nr:hypothetical protein [Alphaproteobacteria bacterium]